MDFCKAYYYLQTKKSGKRCSLLQNPEKSSCSSGRKTVQEKTFFLFLENFLPHCSNKNFSHVKVVTWANSTTILNRSVCEKCRTKTCRSIFNRAFV